MGDECRKVSVCWGKDEVYFCGFKFHAWGIYGLYLQIFIMLVKVIA